MYITTVMKNFLFALLLFPLLSYSQYDCTVRVYQDKWEIYNHTTITWQNGRKYISAPSCCTSFGPDPLIIATDTANGVYPSNGNMWIHDYVEGALFDTSCSRTELTDGYKSSFYFQTCGTAFPYEYKNGVITNVVTAGLYGYTPAQFDTLLNYFTPDPNIALIPCIPDQDPNINGAIALSIGHRDCYFGNKLIDITGIPDGVYILSIDVNMPPRVNDLQPDLHKFSHTVRITGDVLTWVDVALPECCPNVQLLPVSNALADGRNITFNGSSDACSYLIKREVFSQGEWLSDPFCCGANVEVTGTSYTDNGARPKNTYRWWITAKNNGGTSLPAITNKTRVNK